MGSTVLFDREPCVGGVVGAGDVDINEACEGIFGGSSRFWTEMVFDIACSEWRRVHATSEENGVNEIT